MSIHVSAELYIRCYTSQQCERLREHLNEETRFNSPEEAPTEEVEWVLAFEFVENPTKIKTIDDKTLLVEFYPDETDFTDEAKDLINILLQIVGVEFIIYCEIGEDWTSFEYLTKNKQQLLWVVEGFDDESEEKYNHFLNETEKDAFQALLYDEDNDDVIEIIALKLAQKLLNP